MAFSPDGRRLATSNRKAPVKVWDAQTGQEQFTCRTDQSESYDVAFSPDGKRLASMSADRTVKVWDGETGQELFSTAVHRSGIQCLAFSPDGSRLFTASPDGTLKVWDAVTGEELLTLRGHAKFIWSLAVSPDGQRLASGDGKGIVKVWEVTPPTAELRLRRKAGAWMNPLAWEGLLPDEIHERLRNDRSLSEPVRQQALELTQRYQGDPRWLAGAAGRVVSKPGADAAAYGLALRRVEAARRLIAAGDAVPHVILSTLGMAQYRAGNYEEALATLPEYERLLKRADTTTLGYAAMAHHQLGRKDQARDTLDRLRKELQARGGQPNASVQALLREAEALILGQAAQPKP